MAKPQEKSYWVSWMIPQAVGNHYALGDLFVDCLHEYNRARERIREALPLADACGLVNIVASPALLWAAIDLAEGKTTSAATWLVTARNKFAAGSLPPEGLEPNHTRINIDVNGDPKIQK